MFAIIAVSWAIRSLVISSFKLCRINNTITILIYTIIASIKFRVFVPFIIITEHGASFFTIDDAITIGVNIFKSWTTIMVSAIIAVSGIIFIIHWLAFKTGLTQIIGSVAVTISIISAAAIRARISNRIFTITARLCHHHCFIGICLFLCDVSAAVSIYLIEDLIEIIFVSPYGLRLIIGNNSIFASYFFK